MGLADELASALKTAPSNELSADLVESCLDSRAGGEAARAEAQFQTAFRGALAVVPRTERSGGLNGVTGHIAESVVEVMLVERGWIPLEHFVGPFSGGHGVDLAMAPPDFSAVFAIEVKGTLVPRRWPRLRRGDLPQLSPEWLAKDDNPGVTSLGIEADAFSVMAVLIQFGRREWRAAVSTDLETANAVRDLGGLDGLPSRAALATSVEKSRLVARGVRTMTG